MTNMSGWSGVIEPGPNYYYNFATKDYDEFSPGQFLSLDPEQMEAYLPQGGSPGVDGFGDAALNLFRSRIANGETKDEAAIKTLEAVTGHGRA